MPNWVDNRAKIVFLWFLLGALHSRGARGGDMELRWSWTSTWRARAAATGPEILPSDEVGACCLELPGLVDRDGTGRAILDERSYRIPDPQD